jgi:hypothetical protein
MYIKQMTSVRLFDNTFYGNAPVYALAEHLYSPYRRLFSARSITYYDPECADEFEYLQSCNKNYDGISSFGGLQWPVIQGTVYVEFCQSDNCFN